MMADARASSPKVLPGRPGIARRWATFVAERFPPIAHVIMAGAFFLGNWAAASAFMGIGWKSPANVGSVVALVAAFIATLLIFFRLRAMDEIKDYQSDRSSHPDRPMPRGLISPREAKTMVAAGALAEFVLSAICGPAAMLAWAVLFAFSLLMFREFFIGPWLRPKTELYAITHTLVAGWMGLFIACGVSGLRLWELPSGAWVLALANWSVFNVYEFARKTFAPEEEQSGLESYSKRLGPQLAAVLSVAMAAGATAATWATIPRAGVWLACLVVLVAAGSVPYCCRPNRTFARLFRGVTTAFLVAFYVALACAEWCGR